MDSGGEVTRVELGGGGGGRRRWWLLVAAALAVWLVAAVALSGGGGADVVAPTTTTPTSRPMTSSTAPATTTAVPGAPLLGRPTGWTLLVAGRRMVDLDSGVVTEVELPRIEVTTPHGVFTMPRDGGVEWRPFPFDEGTVVPLQARGNGFLLAAPEEGVVWEPLRNSAELISLTDGSVLGAVDLPAGTRLSGALGRRLVVGGGGRVALLDVDGSVTDLGVGEPILVAGRRVLVRACDGALRCEISLVDVDTGERRQVSGLPPEGQYDTGPVGPTGWPLISTAGQGSMLLGPNGDLRLLPDDVPPNALYSAWTPDGEHLLVPAAGEILVVDPDVDDEARVVHRFELSGASNGQLAVLTPPAT